MIICLDYDSTNNIMLSNLEDNIIHSDPIIGYIGSKLITNFDILLDLTGSYKKYSQILETKYLYAARLDKRYQVLNLIKNDINVPKTAFVEECSTNGYNDFLVGICSDFDDEIIIKSDNGARGVGQIKLNSRDLYRCLAEIKENKISTNSSYYTIGGEDKDRKEYLDIFLKDTYIIQEFLPLQREFRLLFSHKGEILDLVERNINSQQGFQSNGGDNLNVDISELPNDLLNKLMFIFEYYPFGSVDIYQDIKGNFGVFEYCPQFGYRNHSTIKVNDIINVGINSYIGDYE